MGKIRSHKNRNRQSNRKTVEIELKPIAVKKNEEIVIEKICRVCLDAVDPESNDVVRPCKCRNYIHHKCYSNWKRDKVIKNKHITCVFVDKCEICSVQYKILDTVEVLNKEKIMSNWYDFLWLTAFAISMTVPFFWSFDFLINFPNKNTEKTLYLSVYHFEAMIVSLLSQMYLIDFYSLWVIGKSKNSAIMLHLKMLDPRRGSNDYVNFYSNLLIMILLFGFLTATGLLFNSFSDKDDPTQFRLFINIIIHVAIYLICVILVRMILYNYMFLFIQQHVENVERGVTPKRFKDMIFFISAQLFIHGIGVLMTWCIPPANADDITIIYIIKNTGYAAPNIFTYAYGFLWILGSLILLHFLTHICYGIYLCFYKCCCAKTEIVKLANYQDN